jgi:hypothetical protein
MSPTDVERASERDAKHYELVRGALRHKPIGMRSMFIAGLICARLNEALYPHAGVAEVLSPTMTAFDWDDRVTDYLNAGVPLVWVVNPERQTIRSYWADETTRLYGSGECIENEPLLPDVRLEVAQVFPRE